MVREISIIITEAFTKKDLNSLIELWNEIANNKYNYPLVQIREAKDTISNLALSANGCDLEKSKFYHALRSQSIDVN